MKRKRHLILLVLAASVAGLPACGGSTPVPAQEAAATRDAAPAATAPAPNTVTDWAAIVQSAIHSPAEPRNPASAEILATTVHLAVYDAVMAIDGGHEPYATTVDAPDGADIGAAVATAAYRATRGRVGPTQFAYLDGEYEAYVAAIPDGPAKADGITVGEAAAAGLLARRAGDGLDAAVDYRCSAEPLPPGEFEPNDGCGTQPVAANVGAVTPFTFDDPARFRPDGPDPLTSDRWARDLNEVKAYGGTVSSARTPEQTDIAYFWSEHAYVHWNRNLIGLAVARGLDVADTARLFALVHTAGSDAAIAGAEAKYFYRLWRPRTAIPRAGEDGNPGTQPDPAWTPLLTVNHPEYPSGHAYFSTAITDAVAAFFGTDQVELTIETSKTAVPQLVRTERTYANLDALMDDVGNARIWAGLHYRNSMDEGAVMGEQIAHHVALNHFRPAG